MLSQEHYESKSLTAIAIAAHEIGHAIQDQQGDKRGQLPEQKWASRG